MKSPAFQFYPKDFLVDTAMLSNEQVGAYWRLCSYAWVGVAGSQQCHLPGDDKTLASLCQVTLSRWRKTIAPAVLTLFCKTENGWRHKRLEAEFIRQMERSTKARESARARWISTEDQDANALRTHDSDDANALRTVCSSSSSASASALKALRDPSDLSRRSNGTDHPAETSKLATEREELRWRRDEVWAAFLAQRDRFYSRRNGKAPGRPPELTPNISRDILARLREHDRDLLKPEQREEWKTFSKVRGAGIGMFLSPWHTGREKNNDRLFLEPWRPWRAQRGKGDPVETFSSLYMEAKGR